MIFEVLRVIPPDHPSLAGHFPDAKIVPGVVLLDEVVAALAEWRQDSQLTGIPSVKFIGPIKPGQSFVIVFDSTDTAENQIDFCCRLDGRVVVEGRLEISCGACI
jgi:3-hydroxyacyl-[acyl-carrier-protein] dehydratase